jgi:hypothetical protein
VNVPRADASAPPARRARARTPIAARGARTRRRANAVEPEDRSMRLRSWMLAAAVAGALAACANPEKVAAADAAPATPSAIAGTGGDPLPAAHAAPGLPGWLAALVADYDAQPARTAAEAVFELPYRGATAYLVTAACCDQFNPLYDARGVVICHPSGGFTGRGDGKCPAPLPPDAARREVWRHR